LSDAVLARMFVDVVGRSPALNGLLHRHVHVPFNQVAWSSACNRAHTTEQRCARWLLMTHDRVASDRYFPTQEFLMRSWGHSTSLPCAGKNSFWHQTHLFGREIAGKT
jgi:hypothetical protein